MLWINNCKHIPLTFLYFSVECWTTKAPFIWRKVVPGKRLTLLAESTLPSVYMSKKLTPLPDSRAGFAMTTVLAHALIVSPWPSWPGWASQSVYMEKSWPLCPIQELALQWQQCSRMLWSSLLDRVDPAGRAKVFIWRKVSPGRRVTLPSE